MADQQEQARSHGAVCEQGAAGASPVDSKKQQGAASLARAKIFEGDRLTIFSVDSTSTCKAAVAKACQTAYLAILAANPQSSLIAGRVLEATQSAIEDDKAALIINNSNMVGANMENQLHHCGCQIGLIGVLSIFVYLQLLHLACELPNRFLFRYYFAACKFRLGLYCELLELLSHSCLPGL